MSKQFDWSGFKSEIEGIAIIVVLKSKRKIFAVNTTGKTTNNNFLSINIPFQK